MIFITVGSQKFQFDRLLQIVDELIDEKIILETVFAQIGTSTYTPRNYKYKKFLDMSEYQETIDRASIILTHAGTGSIISALKKKKKIIVMPRQSKYEEHVDDHQLQIASVFKEKDYIMMAQDKKNLEKCLIEIKEKKFNQFNSNSIKYINFIKKIIC